MIIDSHTEARKWLSVMYMSTLVFVVEHLVHNELPVHSEMTNELLWLLIALALWPLTIWFFVGFHRDFKQKTLA